MNEPAEKIEDDFCHHCGLLIGEEDHPTGDCPLEADRVKIDDLDVRASFDIDKIARLQVKIDWHEKVMQGVMDFHKDQMRRLENQIKFWSTCLENYLRSTENKTMKFSSGEIKLRTVGGNVEITEGTKAVDYADSPFVKEMPLWVIDKTAIKDAHKSGQDLPEFASITPKVQKFSYKLYGGNN